MRTRRGRAGAPAGGSAERAWGANDVRVANSAEAEGAVIRSASPGVALDPGRRTVGRHDERRRAVVAARVHLGALREQQLGDRGARVVRGDEERRLALVELGLEMRAAREHRAHLPRATRENKTRGRPLHVGQSCIGQALAVGESGPRQPLAPIRPSSATRAGRADWTGPGEKGPRFGHAHTRRPRAPGWSRRGGRRWAASRPPAAAPSPPAAARRG